MNKVIRDNQKQMLPFRRPTLKPVNRSQEEAIWNGSDTDSVERLRDISQQASKIDIKIENHTLELADPIEDVSMWQGTQGSNDFKVALQHLKPKRLNYRRLAK